jgi:membrane-associated phospholipid phosphatase
MKKALSTQYIILFIAAIIALIFTMYIGNFVLNTSTFYWNTFLVNITFMGDAFFAFGVSLFLLFYFNKKKLAINLFITILFTLFLVQVIKNLFGNQPLQLFFESGTSDVEGDSIFYRNFISSHTAIAFTLAIYFAKQVKKIAVHILLFSTAVFVAYTRVIFAEESLIALFFGLLPAISSIFLINKLNLKKESNKGYFYKNNRLKVLNRNPLLQV